MPLPFRRASLLLPLLPLLSAVVGCAGNKFGVVDHEDFDSTTTYARTFAATDAQTCEAARRALLSQGYLITNAKPDLVSGRKHFQPESEIHVEVEFRVVCAQDGSSGKSTIAFVSALQDRYTLKKSATAASVGVSVLGSVSLPFSSSNDSLVKVASETITTGPFYDRFFALMYRYLAVPLGREPAPEPEPKALGTPGG